MVFITAKSKQANKFNLDGFGAKKAVKSYSGLSPWQKIVFVTIAGALLALSSPGFDCWWLAWFMVAPFLVVLSFCRRNTEAFLIGLFFGLGYHLLSLHYYLGMSIGGAGHSLTNWQTASLIWIVQAVIFSLPTAVFAWLLSCLPLRPGYMPYFRRPFFSYLLSVPLLWVFLHWGLSIAHPFSQIWRMANVPYVFIDPLAYSQYCVLSVLQLVKFIGPTGLEFLLLLVNAAIAAFFIEYIKTQDGPVERVDLISPRLGALLDVVVAIIIVIVANCMGQWQIAHAMARSNYFNLNNDPKSELAQPIEPVGLACNDRFMFKTNALIDKQLAIIVFPEASREISFDQANSVLHDLKEQAKQNNSSVFLNFVSKDREELVRHNLVFTSANSFSIKQPVLDAENESALFHFLPMPLQKWLFLLDKNSPNSWYALGVPQIREGKVGLLSGSDITDYRLVAHEVRHGASLIISSSDLSWSADKYLNSQILATAIFRAVENQRYVLVSTNGGLAAVIEPSGIVQSLSMASTITGQSIINQKSMLLGTVQFLWSKTPFTKMWWF